MKQFFAWVARGVFRHKHICETTRRATIELPKKLNGSIDEAIEEFERNHTCDCPVMEFENSVQDELKFIISKEVTIECDGRIVFKGKTLIKDKDLANALKKANYCK